MSIINAPPDTAVDTQDGKLRLQPPSSGWRAFFSSVFNVCVAMTLSGATAQRPATLLWTGRFYFDATLGIPIWYTTGGVWVNSAGAPV